MRNIQRVKMYKSGKIWVAAGVAALAFAGATVAQEAGVTDFGQQMTVQQLRMNT